MAQVKAEEKDAANVEVMSYTNLLNQVEESNAAEWQEPLFVKSAKDSRRSESLPNVKEIKVTAAIDSMQHNRRLQVFEDIPESLSDSLHSLDSHEWTCYTYYLLLTS